MQGSSEPEMKPPDFSIVLSRKKSIFFPYPNYTVSICPEQALRETSHSRQTKCPRGHPIPPRGAGLGSIPIQPFSLSRRFEMPSEGGWKDNGARALGKGQPCASPGEGRGSRRAARPPRGAAGASAPRARARFPPAPRPAPARRGDSQGAARRSSGRVPGSLGPGPSQVWGGAAGGPALSRPGARAAIVSAPPPPPRAPEAARPRPPALGPLSARPLASGGGPAPHLPPAAAPGRVLARGLAASGGGGAAGPSDHLWKRRGGGRLLVQLQPTNGAYFGAPAAPSRRTAPRRPGNSRAAGLSPSRRAPRSRWDGFPGTARGREPCPLRGSVSQAHGPPSIFPLDKL